MARKTQSYEDSKGNLYRRPEDATKADLAALLGKVGDGESLAPGIAATLLAKREEIEKVFREHDHMTAPDVEAG